MAIKGSKVASNWKTARNEGTDRKKRRPLKLTTLCYVQRKEKVDREKRDVERNSKVKKREELQWKRNARLAAQKTNTGFNGVIFKYFLIIFN